MEGSEANVTGGKGLERQGLVQQLLKAFGRQVSWGRKNRIFFPLACFFLGFALQLQCLCPGVNCSLCEESCCPEFNFGQIQSFIAISGTEVGEFHCDHQQCDIWIGNSGTGVGNIWIGRTQLVKFA